MARFHIVRVGALGHVGRFAAVDAARYPRRCRVIVRTGRGLEIGEVLTPPDEERPSRDGDGIILRGMTIEDQLLEARLLKNKQAAYDACQSRLQELNLPAVLMDVEHLFDGQTLVFYFLGEQPAEIEPLLAELTELYDAQVQFRSFTDAVTVGCGPACGTETATGCGSCSTGCAVAAACSSHHHGAGHG
jgi:cell fate regulator YaaT (PSP1 superfamily)